MKQTVLSAAVILALLVAAGCRESRHREMLEDAWNRCEALDYAGAMPLVRDYLARFPRDPVAHYLLGKCYLNYDPPELTLAKGQFDTARHFFDTHGDLSVLADMMTAAEFQATLHCDTALVLMRTVVEAEKAGLTPLASTDVLRAALDHARKGLYFNPKSSFLQELTITLEYAIDALDKPGRPTPAPAPAPRNREWTT